MKTNKLILIVAVMGALMSTAFYTQQDSITIYLVGDSTMANKPGTPEENPERGWGQLLPTFFKPSVKIENHAVNGRSSKSFITEGRWKVVLEKLQSGDYVFIQFGHNDQKTADSSRYTNPWTGYRRNLQKYVTETKAKGAYPVILSSIVRRKFNEQGTLVDTHGAYPFVARSVAEQMDVPFIDMQLLTEDYVIALGPDESKGTYLWVAPGEYDKFPEGKQDDTHLNLKGATAYADLVISAIKAMKMPLESHLK
ncbi:MAG: rhamnogalacturonan acetylesterase [Lewinella sp.]|uniref:rhamnogalacturonan acetylesterase n=1 Tax=Lewinella sp. TaxID=2004506 RepID=UPI003D6B9B89